MGWYGPTGKCGCCDETSDPSEPSHSFSESFPSQSISSSVTPIPCNFCNGNLGAPVYALTGPFTNPGAKLVISGFPATLTYTRTRDFFTPQTVTVTGLDGANGTYSIPFSVVDGCLVWDDFTVESSWYTVTTTTSPGGGNASIEWKNSFTTSPTPHGQNGVMSTGRNSQNRNPNNSTADSYAWHAQRYIRSEFTLTPNLSNTPDSELNFFPCRIVSLSDLRRHVEVSMTRTVVQKFILDEFDLPDFTFDLFSATYTFSLGEL